METIKNILPIIQISLAITCWAFIIYYVFERLKERRNDKKDKTN